MSYLPLEITKILNILPEELCQFNYAKYDKQPCIIAFNFLFLRLTDIKL